MKATTKKLPTLLRAVSYILIVLTAFSAQQTIAASVQQPTVAIVIDDIGNDYENGKAIALLPFPLTMSFLPKRPHTQKLIKLARQNQKEIMLHAPMENSLGIDLGHGGLHENMSELEIKSTLLESIDLVPGLVGINNHMGSKLTSNPKVMRWVMEVIRTTPYYFLDSRTSAESVAAKLAASHGIPNISRNIFLDHEQTRKYIQQQFLKLIDMARERGSAIAIAHPHDVTVNYLRWALTKLDEKGIRLATASALWQIRHPTKRTHKD